MRASATSLADAADAPTGRAMAARIADQFLAAEPALAARALEELETDELRALFAAMPATRLSPAVQRMNPDVAAAALAELDDAKSGELLQALDPVRAAGLLARLAEPARQHHLSLLPSAVARDLSQVLAFPHGSAGWLMDPRVTTFTEDAVVEDALARIRAVQGRRVTDVVIAMPEGDYVGVVALQDLVGAPADQPLSALTKRGAPSIPPMATRHDVVELMNRHMLASVPVVGLDGKLLGIIRYDSLMSTAQEIAGEDLAQMVGASTEERALSSPWFSVKSRLPWLQINLLTAFLASAVVGLFDATIAQFTALAVLMPVVAGQSGNTGAQALAVTSRGLALREIRVSHVWRVLGKELVAALINGSAVAVVTSLGVLLWSGSGGLAFVIGTSMVASMVLAALAGGAIPILLTMLNRDPATASSIVLTTVTDVCGFFSFLGLATLLSGWLS